MHAFPPFGYKVNRETQKLEIDYIVKIIFKLKFENKSNTQIVKVLNDEKIVEKIEQYNSSGTKDFKLDIFYIQKIKPFFIGNKIYY